MRSFTRSRSMWDSESVSPIPAMRLLNDMAPPVAIIAFDGMQSHRCAAPPTTSRSTMTTSAPNRAAWVAAVLPAGPPPTITKRMAIATRLVSRLPVAVDGGVGQPHGVDPGRGLGLAELLGLRTTARNGERSARACRRPATRRAGRRRHEPPSGRVDAREVGCGSGARHRVEAAVLAIDRAHPG